MYRQNSPRGGDKIFCCHACVGDAIERVFQIYPHHTVARVERIPKGNDRCGCCGEALAEFIVGIIYSSVQQGMLAHGNNIQKK